MQTAFTSFIMLIFNLRRTANNAKNFWGRFSNEKARKLKRCNWTCNESKLRKDEHVAGRSESTTLRCWLSWQRSTVNDIITEFRRHDETSLLFLLSAHLPPSSYPHRSSPLHATPLPTSDRSLGFVSPFIKSLPSLESRRQFHCLDSGRPKEFRESVFYIP